jgi:hypothetical protein
MIDSDTSIIRKQFRTRKQTGCGDFIHLASQADYWLRQFGGKLSLSSDRDGLYLVLQGVSSALYLPQPFGF